MFNVGDKVECVHPQSAGNHSINKGYVGIITHVDGDYSIAVDDMLGFGGHLVMSQNAFILIDPAPIEAESFNPIYCRDRIKEIDSLVENLEEERVSLVQALEDEGFSLIKKINKQIEECKQSHEDMSDWRNWREGDIVECLTVPGKHKGWYTKGYQYAVGEVDVSDAESDSEVDVMCDDKFTLWCPADCFKFHSRPQ